MDFPYTLRKASIPDLHWLLALPMETMAGYLEISGADLTKQDHTKRILQRLREPSNHRVRQCGHRHD